MYHFFFTRFQTPELTFRHRLAWSVIQSKAKFDKPVSVRTLAALTSIHASETLPSVLADLAALNLIEHPVKRRPLMPLEPADGLCVPRTATGPNWCDRLAFIPCTLTDGLMPLTSVLFGVLKWWQSLGNNRPYQSSLATIIGCHENTIADHLHRLAHAGLVQWSQEVRGAIKFTLTEKPLQAKAEKPKPTPKPTAPALAPERPSRSPVEVLADMHDIAPDSIYWNLLSHLYRAGATAERLHQYVNALTTYPDHDSALPCEVARRLMAEAATEHSGKPGQWFPLFHYKVKHYAARTNRFTFEGETMPEPPKPKPKPQRDVDDFDRIGFDWPMREIG